jgi:hypothetical protein
MSGRNEGTTEKFLFHFNYFKNAQRLKSKQDRCDFYDALMNYVFFGELPEFSDKKYLVQVVFESTMDSLDAARRKYNAAVENGKLGGRPQKGKNKTQQKPSKNQWITSGITSEKPVAKPVENQNKIKENKEGYTLRYNHSIGASADGPDGPQPSAPEFEPYTMEQAIADIEAKAAAKRERERIAEEAKREEWRKLDEQREKERAERLAKAAELRRMAEEQMTTKEAEVSAG